MAVGISLANKCQLVFGFAVVAILAAALSVPWVRTRMLVREGQFEAARQLADAWLAKQIQLNPVELHGGPPLWINDLFDDPDTAALLRITIVEIDEIDTPQDGDPFIAAALRRFQKDEQVTEHTDTATVSGKTVYRYARVLRESQLRALGIQFSSEPSDPAGADPIRAVLVFYLILTKLILSPVRRLRETTEKVQTGGRVLGVTATAPTIAEAQARAYAAVDAIDWPQGFCRRDIAWRVVGR